MSVLSAEGKGRGRRRPRAKPPRPRASSARRRMAVTGALAVCALLGVAHTSDATAQTSDVLPQMGALALAGQCSLTLDATPYSRCECRMAVSVDAGRYLLSMLKVACGGRAGQAPALAGLMGSPGRTVQLQYDYAGGSGMWVTTSAATVDDVTANEGALQLTLRLDGPTHFENSHGRACVDGATGARC